MTRFNDAESAFLEEVDSKRSQTANYRAATKGRRLGKSKVMFASDYMSRKEKLEYRRAGEVMTTNMYEDILTEKQFDELENQEKKNRMQYWRNNYTIKTIQTEMGINNAQFYKIINQLDLPKAERSKRKDAAKPKVRAKAPAKKEEETAPVAVEKRQESMPIQEIIVDGLHLAFHGTYSAEHIIKQLSKFELLLDGEEDEFYVELKLMQKQSKK
jgi:hypothetical protein